MSLSGREASTGQAEQTAGRDAGSDAPKAVPASETRAAAKAVPIDSFRAQKEIRSLLFIAEQYLGKTLTHAEMETITYFYDTLHMSSDLIEYLIESCV